MCVIIVVLTMCKFTSLYLNDFSKNKIPIIKSPNPTSGTNENPAVRKTTCDYRPVTLTPHVMKSLGRLVMKHLRAVVEPSTRLHR